MIRIFNHYVSRIGVLLLLLELLILLTATAISVLMRLPRGGAGLSLWPAPALAALLVLSMGTLGMYQHSAHENVRHTLLRILPAFALGYSLFSLLARPAPAFRLDQAGGLALLLGAVSVLLTRLVVFKSAELSVMEQRLILIGDGATARECMALAARRGGFHQFHVVGCMTVAGETRCVPASALLPEGTSLLALARQLDAHEIVVSVSDRRNGAFPVRQLLECALGGVRVIDAATFFEREACQIRVDALLPSFLIFGGGFDLLASAVICVAALPLLLVAALAIRLDDGGPVFYQQARVGKDGRPFQVLKLRSMRRDAEPGGTPTWASADDPRVTRVGHWLRKLRIDELPQMLNVLRGEMSFVGPRPERAYFVELLCAQIEYYHVRHSIKPGVTGLAQVRYRYGASVQDAVQKLQYDLYYVKNNSLFLDLLILIDTVQVVLLGKGSR
ncbi:TIGR03013 family XrtA/PEP-CTERM system glycosyltransferase [Rugamonas sp.]|uniref:TIGR03013 family XrtA/PEP-CTERM system glycosyltransferase n=1 Tax=Rugamonas sp. TaxID=1926287 RepID=UPI0025CD7039|nr:TIGR03013 family XrtA/PEP-CTERM system glycosyltransferase [Rugamonas sp.]